MSDFFQPGDWSWSVWINIITSLSVSVCFFVYLGMAWIRRGRLNVIQDGERWGITGVLTMLIAFFLGRGIQIAHAGRTVAEPWFLAIGVGLAISCSISAVIVLRNHDDYGVLSQRQWNGDIERRSGLERRTSE